MSLLKLFLIRCILIIVLFVSCKNNTSETDVNKKVIDKIESPNLIVNNDFVKEFNTMVRNNNLNDSLIVIEEAGDLLFLNTLSNSISYREFGNFNLCLLKSSNAIFLLNQREYPLDSLDILIESYANQFNELGNDINKQLTAPKSPQKGKNFYEINLDVVENEKLTKEQVIFLFKILRKINTKIDEKRNEQSLKRYKSEYVDLEIDNKKHIKNLFSKTMIIKTGIDCSKIYYPPPVSIDYE